MRTGGMTPQYHEDLSKQKQAPDVTENRTQKQSEAIDVE